MVEVRRTCELGSPVADVWALVRDFQALILEFGLPVTFEGEGIGQTRTIAGATGNITERFDACDEARREIVYSIVDGDVPVRDYRATMQLTEIGADRTRLDWTGVFEVGDPAKVDEASRFIGGNYKAGMAGLQRRFGA
ncbi:MAG: hypothetical protein JWN46_2289 [Acidimicrobiales bacterium]|nr:hypothetical protein [Acidimicrobiales bacterium]